MVEILDAYNNRMERKARDEQVITYTDMVGTLMSSCNRYCGYYHICTDCICGNFAGGIFNYDWCHYLYQCVRAKKRNRNPKSHRSIEAECSQVFNAETFIIGLCAGLIGIGFTLLLIIPVNAIIHNLANTTDVSAVLPVVPALVLILLSILLTLLGGLIPSKNIEE